MSARILNPGEGQMTGVAGDIYTIKASSRDTNGAYTIMEAIIPAQKGPPPHRHSREEESFFILDGELEFLQMESEVWQDQGLPLPFRSVHCITSEILVIHRPEC